MKNNQNITQQIQTSLKHLGALLFLLLTVIVLINCSEDGGISGGGVSGGETCPTADTNSMYSTVGAGYTTDRATSTVTFSFDEDIASCTVDTSDIELNFCGNLNDPNATTLEVSSIAVSATDSKKLVVTLADYPAAGPTGSRPYCSNPDLVERDAILSTSGSIFSGQSTSTGGFSLVFGVEFP